MPGQQLPAIRSIHHATSSCLISAHQERGSSSSEGGENTDLRESRIKATDKMRGSFCEEARASQNCQQGEFSPCIAAQIPEPVKSYRRQKQEREQEAPLRVEEMRWRGLRHARTLLLPWQDVFQLGQERGFVSRSQQQEPSCSLLPLRLASGLAHFFFALGGGLLTRALARTRLI